jgi:hypothetical protein
MTISCVFEGYKVLRNRPIYCRVSVSVLMKCGRNLSDFELAFAISASSGSV